jgi:hypothetical protein
LLYRFSRPRQSLSVRNRRLTGSGHWCRRSTFKRSATGTWDSREITVPKAVVLVNPAHIELQSEPIPTQWILSGAPEARGTKLTTSSDGTSSVVVWECTPGSFKWDYCQDETAVIISGEAFITVEGGSERQLRPGDLVFFPAGSTCTWRITAQIRKSAVLRETVWPFLGLALKITKKVLRMKLPVHSSPGDTDKGNNPRLPVVLARLADPVRPQ